MSCEECENKEKCPWFEASLNWAKKRHKDWYLIRLWQIQAQICVEEVRDVIKFKRKEESE